MSNETKQEESPEIELVYESKYKTHAGQSYAAFYYGEEDKIGKPGEVKTKAGKLTEVKIGRDGEWEEFDLDKLAKEGITVITFQTPRTIDLLEVIPF